MIRILVVDDQRLVRRCISAKLNSTDGFDVVGEVDSGERACEFVRRENIDVVLMDLNMPGIGGLEATRHLVNTESNCRVIGLSVYVDGPYPKRFMEVGGSGYVSKAADTEELSQAIRSVADGSLYISQDVAQNIALEHPGSGDIGGFDALSNREIQVLQKISEGVDLDEIAKVMCLSPKTIAHHRRSLCAKLGASNDVQLAIIANARGLSGLDDLSAPALNSAPTETGQP
jgi:two-component system invasion response regulator UvrY